MKVKHDHRRYNREHIVMWENVDHDHSADHSRDDRLYGKAPLRNGISKSGKYFIGQLLYIGK